MVTASEYYLKLLYSIFYFTPTKNMPSMNRMNRLDKVRKRLIFLEDSSNAISTNSDSFCKTLKEDTLAREKELLERYEILGVLHDVTGQQKKRRCHPNSLRAWSTVHFVNRQQYSTCAYLFFWNYDTYMRYLFCVCQFFICYCTVRKWRVVNYMHCRLLSGVPKNLCPRATLCPG